MKSTNNAIFFLKIVIPPAAIIGLCAYIFLNGGGILGSLTYILFALPLLGINKISKNISSTHLRNNTSYPAFRFLAIVIASMMFIISAILLFNACIPPFKDFNELMDYFSLEKQNKDIIAYNLFLLWHYTLLVVSIVILYLGKLLHELLSIFCDIADSNLELYNKSNKAIN